MDIFDIFARQSEFFLLYYNLRVRVQPLECQNNMSVIVYK